MYVYPFVIVNNMNKLTRTLNKNFLLSHSKLVFHFHKKNAHFIPVYLVYIYFRLRVSFLRANFIKK